jgi:hypothetical protein
VRVAAAVSVSAQSIASDGRAADRRRGGCRELSMSRVRADERDTPAGNRSAATDCDVVVRGGIWSMPGILLAGSVFVAAGSSEVVAREPGRPATDGAVRRQSSIPKLGGCICRTGRARENVLARLVAAAQTHSA